MTTLQHILKLKQKAASFQEEKRELFSRAKSIHLAVWQGLLIFLSPVIIYSAYSLARLLASYQGQCQFVLGQTYACNYWQYLNRNVVVMFVGHATYALLFYGFFIILPLTVLVGVPAFFKALPKLMAKIER